MAKAAASHPRPSSSFSSSFYVSPSHRHCLQIRLPHLLHRHQVDHRLAVDHQSQKEAEAALGLAVYLVGLLFLLMIRGRTLTIMSSST